MKNSGGGYPQGRYGPTSPSHPRLTLLTGVKYKLCELMQSYLDKTSDVQTVCLALTLARKYDTTLDTVYEADPTAIHNVVFENYLRFFGKCAVAL